MASVLLCNTVGNQQQIPAGFDRKGREGEEGGWPGHPPAWIPVP